MELCPVTRYTDKRCQFPVIAVCASGSIRTDFMLQQNMIIEQIGDPCKNGSDPPITWVAKFAVGPPRTPKPD
jgi:hypothetical protein